MISLTLPSIYPEGLARTLLNVRDTCQGHIEVVVVSPFEPDVPDGLDVTWVVEAKQEGCNAAHARALTVARGDFVMPWVDDHLFVNGWDIDLAIDFVAREAQFAKRSDGPFALGARQIEPAYVGTVFGVYYPYFPLMRTPAARAVGWYRPEFRVGFADVDLGFRVWRAGGRCEWAAQGSIIVHQDDRRKDALADYRAAVETDQRAFLAKWEAIYGEGWPTANLRDFNLDVALASVEPDRRTFAPGETAKCA